MKRRVLPTAATVAVFLLAAALVAAFFGAYRQFRRLRCNVEKPRGDYENAAAVADYDDLMPLGTGVYTFADGATVDLWAVDEEYWGVADGDFSGYPWGEAANRRYPAAVYALSSGEILVEVLPSFNGVFDIAAGTTDGDPDTLCREREYITKHPPFELDEQLEYAYERFRAEVEAGREYRFFTVELNCNASLSPGGRVGISCHAYRYILSEIRRSEPKGMDSALSARFREFTWVKTESEHIGLRKYEFDRRSGVPLDTDDGD